MKNVQKRYDWGIPQGTYRDIFSHYPLAKDFPACYRFSCNQDGSSSFETYLELYDKVIEDGLEELKKLPRLLSIINGTELPAKVIYERKSRYLDFLDRLYGVESYPDWMKEYGGYGETKEEPCTGVWFLTKHSTSHKEPCRSKKYNRFGRKREYHRGKGMVLPYDGHQPE